MTECEYICVKYNSHNYEQESKVDKVRNEVCKSSTIYSYERDKVIIENNREGGKKQ